jgi:hypothetical protein
VVDTTSDAVITACTGAAADCSLRGALQVANGNGAPDTISFLTSMTITLGSTLQITAPFTTITADPGQVVEINNPLPANAFFINAADTTLDGLRIYGSGPGTAIVWVASPAQRVTISDNVIGDDDLGFLGTCGNSPNSHSGLFISSTVNPGGGDALVWIHGNFFKCIGGAVGHGVFIDGAREVVMGADALGNVTSLTDNFSMLNAGHGVYLAYGATANTIRNAYLQYNNGSGLVIDDSSSNSAFGNIFQVNDQPGVVITNTSTLNVIGCSLLNDDPDVAGRFNVIHNNSSHGIHISGSGTNSNMVFCNRIGLNDAGTAAAANDGEGVLIDRGAKNNIVGASSGTRNVISGNGLSGIRLTGSGTTGNLIQGNRIGTDVAGTSAVPNSQNGVTIDGGAALTTLGGTGSGLLNLIGGNAGHGVRISGSDTATNTVVFNDFGINSFAGDVPLPNGLSGLSLANGTHGNIIGQAGYANWFAFNGAHGLEIAGGATINTVTGNRSFSNTLDGVLLHGGATTLNLITGTTIYGNGEDGIAEANGANLNVWSHLSTYRNGGLGIDKNADDGSVDGATGTLPAVVSVNPATGLVTGTASANALVEVYSVAPDPTGRGEGVTFAGSTVSNASGVWSLTIASPTNQCFTAFETLGFIIYASSEFGPNNCRVFQPLIVR